VGFVYETTVDPNALNNSHAFALDMVGRDRRVLEVGCAAGHVTRILRDRGCQVVAIEIDADAAAHAGQWAERVIVGDVERDEIWASVGSDGFDVVVFGDVLEHLKDPLAALRRSVRTLRADGYIVASIPNVAHGDVRIALLNGTFPYTDVGLLDRTHLQLFTLASVRQLFADAGLRVDELRRVLQPLFQTELGLSPDEVDEDIVAKIHTDPEAETYQFVIRASRAAPSDGMDEVGNAVDRAGNGIPGLGSAKQVTAVDRTRIKDIEATLAQAQAEVAALHGRIKDLEVKLAQAQAEVAALRNTRTFRLTAPLRRVYGRFVRRLPG
jgi:O-antigen biosynthesis protein